MIEVRHLSVHKNDGTELLNDVSFTVGALDKIAIIGEEGNGKSTLLKLIYDKALVTDYLRVAGEISTEHEILGYLPQHLPEKWLNTIPSDYLLLKEPDAEPAAEDFNRLALFSQLADALYLTPGFLEQDIPLSKLSGGEKVKLQLLKLLGSPCTALLLDEPTNDLDIATLEFLEDFIRRSSIPIVFVSHDETLLENCAAKVLHLEQVNQKTKRRFTLYNGSYRSYVDERLRGYEKTMQIARKEKAEYLEKKRKLNDIMNAVHHAQNTITRGDPGGGRLLKKKMHVIKAMAKRFDKESYTTLDHPEEAINVFFPAVTLPPLKRILDISGQSVALPDRTLIEPFDLLVLAKDKVVITGNNGTGKSLLLASIYTQLKTRSDLAIGYMPQDYLKVLTGFTTPLAFLAQDGLKQDIERARELLGAMKFTREEMVRRPEELSDGQKAKLFILKFIKDGKNVLILDEPTRNFSPLSAPVIRNILTEFNGCIISVSHDRLYNFNVCTRILEIQTNRLIEKRL